MENNLQHITSNNEIIQHALSIIDIEVDSILQLKKNIITTIAPVVEVLHKCTGKIVITGIGKSAIIGMKMVSTFNSLSITSQYMHAVDALHGDLGLIKPNDIIIIISKSGESPEIKQIIQSIQKMGNIMIAIVSNIHSYLKNKAHYYINASITKEACIFNIAPTTSTTVQLVIGDVLAICLMKLKNIKVENFYSLHPGGNIGKNLLLTVGQIISTIHKPIVYVDTPIQDIIHTISSNRLGATAVLNVKNEIVGIITDGDIRRMLENNHTITHLKAMDIYNKNAKIIPIDMLASEALQILKTADINQLIVCKDNQYMGVVHIHDIINEGIQ